MVNSSPGSKLFFPQINILRFVSAMGIFIMHMAQAWIRNKTNLRGGRGGEHAAGYAGQLIGNMTLGVDVFFLISGFLITYLLLQEKEVMGNINLKKFFTRRILRIWPLYFFSVFISPFIVMWIGIPSPNYVPSLLFYENFHLIQLGTLEPPLGHLWSICIEEHFYLIWPFLIAFLPKKSLITVFSIILCCSAGFFIYIMSAGYERPSQIIYYNTLSRIDVLVIGAGIAYFYNKRPFTFTIPAYVRIIIYSLLITGCCLTAAIYYTSPFLGLLKRYFFTGLLTLAILDYNFNPGAWFQFRGNKALRYLGKISYGIYMYTPFILLIMLAKVVPLLHISNVYIFILLSIIPGILIPIVSYEFIEKPFLTLKSKNEIIKTDG